MKLPKSVIVLGLIVAAVVIGWKIAFPTNSFRYKVTVNVETPEGLKSDSAVREFTVMQGPELTPEMQPHQIVRGEAVVVDLGKRGVLFATISSDDEYLVFRTFPDGPPGLTREGARYYEQLKAKTILDPLNYPLLVAFKDIKDPKTVTVAYRPITKVKDAPGYQYEVVGVEDHLPELFGPGVRLKDITIEMTDEEVTWRIEKLLPWLNEVSGGYLDGQFSGGGPELSNILNGGNFKAGEKL